MKFLFLASHLFTISIIAYQLIVLCHLCPQVVMTTLPLALLLIPGLSFYFSKISIQLLIYPKQVRKLLGYISGCYMLYLGRAPHIKETLLDFHEWRRVTRHPLVFRGLTGSQRTPGDRSVTAWHQSLGIRIPRELGFG